jgi:hypothetical protein
MGRVRILHMDYLENCSVYKEQEQKVLPEYKTYLNMEKPQMCRWY